MEHMPIATTSMWSRQAAGAWASQYAASPAVRALHLAQQALLPGQVKEAGVPPVGQQHVLAAALIDPPAGAAAAVLVDPQVRHQGGGAALTPGQPDR